MAPHRPQEAAGGRGAAAAGREPATSLPEGEALRRVTVATRLLPRGLETSRDLGPWRGVSAKPLPPP